MSLNNALKNLFRKEGTRRVAPTKRTVSPAVNESRLPQARIVNKTDPSVFFRVMLERAKAAILPEVILFYARLGNLCESHTARGRARGCTEVIPLVWVREASRVHIGCTNTDHGIIFAQKREGAEAPTRRTRADRQKSRQKGVRKARDPRLEIVYREL